MTYQYRIEVKNTGQVIRIVTDKLGFYRLSISGHVRKARYYSRQDAFNAVVDRVPADSPVSIETVMKP